MTDRVAALDPATAEAVTLAYLQAHPDLLLRHPGLLTRLEIPHAGPSGTASLVERQIVMLRGQVAKEQQRLSCLIERAREYEALSQHLHQLTIKLILARSIQQTRDILDLELKAEFAAEAVALVHFPSESQSFRSHRHNRRERQSTPPRLPPSLLELSQRDRCYCGPLSEVQSVDLFGPQGAELRSVALVPLTGPKVHALLAIGSQDPQHFTAEMGTDVLERLGDIASAKLVELA